VTLDTRRGQVEWFVRLRWVAALGALAAPAAARLVLGVRFAILPGALVVAGIFAYNTVLHLWLRRERDERELERAALAQVGLDLVALVLLLYFAGGIENPFSAYLVFHTAIAAVMFPGRESLAVTAGAVALYSAMAALEYAGAIPRFSLEGFKPLVGYGDARQLAASLFVLATTLFTVRYFAVSIARRLVRRTAELARANERLEQADRVRLQAVSTVAHELRSPMAAAESLLETVTGGYVSKACLACESKPILERVRARMKGLIKLTDDLLDLHQLELGNVRFEPQPLDIGAAAAAAVEEMSVLAREAEVTLAAQDLERLPRVLGDPPSVRFVLANLLSNAIRYNRRGGRADVTGSVEGAMVRIAVRDTGVGIPPDEVGKVFDVFFRGSYAREKRRLDTGLGLSLVKGLVEAQGGAVSVESAPGRGSEFAFTLPTAPV
jgi:signal transduction histidine kinase